jgi:hypothetical protein
LLVNSATSALITEEGVGIYPKQNAGDVFLKVRKQLFVSKKYSYELLNTPFLALTFL